MGRVFHETQMVCHSHLDRRLAGKLRLASSIDRALPVASLTCWPQSRASSIEAESLLFQDPPKHDCKVSDGLAIGRQMTSL